MPSSIEQFVAPDAARQFVLKQRFAGKTVGIVPTMGALHEGHLSLVKQSVARCDVTIATIFVNPTQFAAGEDLDKYPRTLDKDLELLQSAGAAGVFLPSNDTMYPRGFSTYVDPPIVARTLEGEHRPTHFRGVTTVVMKLFQILPANYAFFGCKDYQQWKVIQAMTRDLNVEIEVVGCEIIRDHDGLALSSRNRYLDSQQRIRALSLWKALNQAKRRVEVGECDGEQIMQSMREILNLSVDSIDYAVITDADTLSPLNTIDRPAVALIAAHIGTTRLIDNLLITPNE